MDNTLRELHACRPSRRWCRGKTRQQAWEECNNLEWLLYVLIKTGFNVDATAIKHRVLNAGTVAYARHHNKDVANAAYTVACEREEKQIVQELKRQRGLPL